MSVLQGKKSNQQAYVYFFSSKCQKTDRVKVVFRSSGPLCCRTLQIYWAACCRSEKSQIIQQLGQFNSPQKEERSRTCKNSSSSITWKRCYPTPVYRHVYTSMWYTAYTGFIKHTLRQSSCFKLLHCGNPFVDLSAGPSVSRKRGEMPSPAFFQVRARSPVLMFQSYVNLHLGFSILIQAYNLISGFCL